MSAGRPNTETLEAPMLDIGIGDHETLKLCDNVIIFAVINNDQPNTGTAATSVSVTGTIHLCWYCRYLTWLLHGKGGRRPFLLCGGGEKWMPDREFVKRGIWND